MEKFGQIGQRLISNAKEVLKDYQNPDAKRTADALSRFSKELESIEKNGIVTTLKGDFVVILAVGFSPIDVEATSFGTLALLSEQGHKVVVINLTSGKMPQDKRG